MNTATFYSVCVTHRRIFPATIFVNSHDIYVLPLPTPTQKHKMQNCKLHGATGFQECGKLPRYSSACICRWTPPYFMHRSIRATLLCCRSDCHILDKQYLCLLKHDCFFPHMRVRGCGAKRLAAKHKRYEANRFSILCRRDVLIQTSKTPFAHTRDRGFSMTLPQCKYRRQIMKEDEMFQLEGRAPLLFLF